MSFGVRSVALAKQYRGAIELLASGSESSHQMGAMGSMMIIRMAGMMASNMISIMAITMAGWYDGLYDGSYGGCYDSWYDKWYDG